jgi:hypothetical protein
MKQTQIYRKTFFGSVGAGLSSVLGGSGRPYYILEHKINSKYHRAGESQEIIVDQIEIGRAPECAVRFDESFTTVSRRHAAIVRDKDKWKLIQLSNTNPTLLNGNKAGREWYLQNGDEIQLSVGGPKLGFLIPYKKTTGSIGLSRRLDLFGKQVLKPYRWAILLLSLFLLLGIGGGIAYGLLQKKETVKTMEEIKTVVNQNEQLQTQINETEQRRIEDSTRVANLPKVVPPPAIDKLIASVKKDIYFVITETYIRSGNKDSLLFESSATGFILQEGYFVTARHCVEPWLFGGSEESEFANIVSSTYPNDFEVYSIVNVFSNEGLQFKLRSSNFRINRSLDIKLQVAVDEENRPLWQTFAFPIFDDGGEMQGSDKMPANDWAYARVSRRSSLQANYDASVSLQAGEDIHILGFPRWHGVMDGDKFIEPIYNKMSVSRNGLNSAGCIMVSQGADSGNSGGPVFVLRGNQLVVVGIVSRVDSRSRQYNHIVPIKQIKN